MLTSHRLRAGGRLIAAFSTRSPAFDGAVGGCAVLHNTLPTCWTCISKAHFLRNIDLALQKYGEPFDPSYKKGYVQKSWIHARQ